MLQDSHRQISEIALAAGFDSSAHFSRVFKKQTSLSPKEYQEKTADRRQCSILHESVRYEH